MRAVCVTRCIFKAVPWEPGDVYDGPGPVPAHFEREGGPEPVLPTPMPPVDDDEADDAPAGTAGSTRRALTEEERQALADLWPRARKAGIKKSELRGFIAARGIEQATELVAMG